MSAVLEILEKVKQLGGKLSLNGDKLRMLLPADCSPELKNVIRQHKAEIMAILEARACNLTSDCAPWLHIARQVIAGEFKEADRSTVESLKIGLRGIPHPDCANAYKHLAQWSRR